MADRVLVTGASGFLGSAVVDRLRAGSREVVGLDPAAPVHADMRHIRDDLSDSPRLRTLLADERITHIIHAGGVSGPMVLADRPDRVMAINVLGSLNLLFAALETGVKTYVYCSSVSAVGDFYEEHPIDDTYTLQPTSAYGSSKAAMDMVLRGLWQRTALDVCSLRFTGVYGPGRRTSFVIDDIVAAALAGRAARVAPASDWPYVYIDDAADAALAACFSDRRRQLIYFIAYPEQVSLEALAEAAARAGAPVTLDIDRTQAATRRGPVDIGPAVRDFGFAPKVDHREGVRRMIDASRKG